MRVLSAMVGPENSIYVFCAECGDFIMGRLQSGHPPGHYIWDWAVPLRGNVKGRGHLSHASAIGD